MELFREEIFGPVVGVVKADDEEHALKLANDTQFGVATLLAVPWEAMASLQGKHGKPEAAHKVNIWGAVIAVTSFTGAFAGSFVEVMMLPLGEFPTGTAQVAVTLVMWALDGLLARQLPSMRPAGSAGDLEG